MSVASHKDVGDGGMAMDKKTAFSDNVVEKFTQASAAGPPPLFAIEPRFGKLFFSVVLAVPGEACGGERQRDLM